MKSKNLLLLLTVSFLITALNAESQEINDQLNLAARLPYGEVQLNIILDILNRSSGASIEQRQKAAEFQVYKDSQSAPYPNRFFNK
jgi:hypothetical protein